MHSDLDFIAGCRCTFLLSIYSNQNNAQLATCGLEVKRLAHAAEVRETERGNKGYKQEALLLVKYSNSNLINIVIQ